MAEDQQQGSRWSEEDVKQHTQKIREVVERHKKENKDEHFTSVTPEEIEKKFRRVNSPMIVSQGWGGAPPGGTFNYSVTLYNPDPTQAFSLFVHVWVGSGNVDPNVGTFLLNVDGRFPRLTEPQFAGLTLASGASSTLNFSVAVPAGVQSGNYIGNSCLMQLNWHDTGTYLDRGVFVFRVT